MAGDPRRAMLLLVTAAALTTYPSPAGGQPAASAPAASQPAAASGATNPHWSENGCRYCHPVSGSRVSAIKLEEVNRVCWQCHDGKRAVTEVHPVGRLFVGDHVEHPRDWPAPGGRLSCITCHDVRIACDRLIPRPSGNASFLRHVASRGPMAFCAACHAASFQPGGGRLNVHMMLDDQGKPIAEKCHYCHRDSFGLGVSSVRMGDPQLRGDGISLCVACHSRHVDYFEPGHIGRRVPDTMRSRMAAVEPALQLPDRAVAQSRPTDPPVRRLPLEEGERIVCATCHNPHQEGTFDKSSVLSDGAIARGRPQQARLRGLNKDLCHACHE